jgi:hypothetical protein
MTLRSDLRLHRTVGALVSCGVASATAAVGFGLFEPTTTLELWLVVFVAWFYGIVAGMAVGWLKEYAYDVDHGTVDREDFRWTRRGAFEGSAAFLVILGVLAWIA